MIEGDFCNVLLKWEAVIERGYWVIAFLVKFRCFHPHTGGMTLVAVLEKTKHKKVILKQTFQN